ncbi:hypothetical protein [Saccharothrix deserti]|uniref:hypothetical protein n=1 Tax=Saccharothrix deserti TaxID=2593674 RepID=UPI00131D1968|nr:hypothetical protein [Saccharothrix deserti]
MAVSDALRRSGSLLLRALALSGLATAAWFVCAGVASAGEDHSNEITKTLDQVNVALGERQAATAGPLLADVLPKDAAPFTDFRHETFEPPAFEHHPLGVHFGPSERPLAVAHRPIDLVYVPDQGGCPAEDGDYSYPDERYADDDRNADDADEYSYSGYSYSGYSHSGSVSNTMPAPLYEAKVAAKATARAALLEVQAPTPEPTAVDVGVDASPLAGVLPFAPVAPASPDSQITPTAEVIWEVPEPNAPAPAPKQAPAPSAPTASSSSSADNGGGHRGGVIASFTSQSDSKPLTARPVERRDDGRSPGSVPGLPSTSPD